MSRPTFTSLRPIVSAVEEGAAKSARSVPFISGLLLLIMCADLFSLPYAQALLPITLVQGVILLAASQRAWLRRHLDGRARGGAYALSIAACILWAGLWIQKLFIALEAAHAAEHFYREGYRVSGAAITFVGVALVMGRRQRFARYFVAFADAPARQSALSFVALSLFGAVALTLPICVREPAHASFVDALFMATSAVCVTGLGVHGVAQTYTPVGQAVMLVLVQAGGLGIMVLSASMAVLTGRRMRAKSSAALAEVLDTESLASLRSGILRIVGFTLLIEALGAVALYVALGAHPGVELDAQAAHPMAGAGSRWWAAVFHAVSAFCNAGFTLTRDNLVPFAQSYAVCGVVMALVILGGLGFPVLSELVDYVRTRARGGRPANLSLHSRVVLLLSLVLNLGIGAVFCVVEWGESFAALAWGDKLLAGAFHAVSLRTAGFNTVDLAAFRPVSLAVACLFMFVGASPGGTGGGVKVTTFAVLFAAFRAEIRGAAEPVLFDRRIPDTTLQRAMAVGFVSVVVLTFTVLGLLVVEADKEPLYLAFEGVSAFATVGLSAGVTAALSVPGKLIVIITMLIGRVGPLTLAVAASERAVRAHHRLPRERVLIG
jgi:trk system potassium uptake protein